MIGTGIFYCLEIVSGKKGGVTEFTRWGKEGKAGAKGVKMRKHFFEDMVRL